MSTQAVFANYTMKTIVSHLQDPQIISLHSGESMTHVNIPRGEHRRLVGDAQGSLDLGYYEPTPTQTPNLDGSVIGSHLATNTTLGELTLWGNRFPDGIQGIIKALESNRTLHTLRLPVSQLEDVNALGEVLKANTVLTRLKINDTSSLPHPFVPVFDALKANSSLVSLRASLLMDEDVPAVIGALQVNTTLTTLKLSVEKLSLNGFAQFIELSSTLPRQLTMKLDYFTYHPMTHDIYQRLLPLLKQNGSVVAIKLKGYSFDARVQHLESSILERNHDNLVKKRSSLYEMLLPCLKIKDQPCSSHELT